MTPQNDERATDRSDRGHLDGTAVGTTGIDILGASTAHLEIVVPRDDDDAYDDVDDGVDPRVLEGTEGAALEGEPAPRDVDPAPMPTPVLEPASVPSPASGPAAATVVEVSPTTLSRLPAAAAAPAVLEARRIDDLAGDAERETPDLLTAQRLLDPARASRPEPEGAWAQLIYAASGRRINLGDGRRARERKELDARIGAPLAGQARFVDVLSRKGGVGKTTVTTLLGMALAAVREDRIVAVDANPDRGTLADRIARTSGRTVRDLVREAASLRGYNDVSRIVSRDQTRLDVLASDAGPDVVSEFDADEYRAVADVARHYYSVVLTDTGTGIVHSVVGAALDAADLIVVVAGFSIDEARLASETLSWLEANGRGDLARRAIVVLDQTAPGRAPVRDEQIEAHFRSRVAHVVRIPYDPQLAAGGTIAFHELQTATRDAARTLAVTVIEALRDGDVADAQSATTARMH